MRSRTMVCPCEDIEQEEVEAAIERGYTDLEALKRATAVTTGPCQGKHCLSATLRLLAEATGRDPDSLGSITHRPPIVPIPLGALARCPAASQGPGEDATPDEPARQEDQAR